MNIIRSEPDPTETISHMGIMSRKCAFNGKGRKIHNGFRWTPIYERITPQQEIPFKLKVLHYQQGCNIYITNTKVSSIFTVGNQIC